MTEHEKSNLDELKDIDEAAVEEISNNYPMLGRSAKKRILEKCLEKTEEAGFETSGMTVSGTEVYHRPLIRRIAGSAAAIAAAAAVIVGTVFIKRSVLPPVKDPLASVNSSQTEELTEENTDDIYEEEYTEAVTTEAETQVTEVSTTATINFSAVTATSMLPVTTMITDTTEETTTSEETTTDDENSTEATTETEAELTVDYLAGKWSATGYTEARVFEFYEDIAGGKYNNVSDGTGLPFSYEINGNIITFRFGGIDTDPDNVIVDRDDSDHMTFHWENGRSESLTRTNE